MSNGKRFTDKVVVITGGSRGIGKAIAARFLNEGASVCIAANEERVHETAEQLKEIDSAGSVWSQLLDVTDAKAVEAFYDETASELGSIDISIQNAGVITIATLDKLTEAEWDTVMDVNTKGVFLCCQQAARHMLAQGRGGRIINTASGQARQGFIYTPHYAASKFGVVGITQSLAQELAKTGITVNAFCPGIIDTEMWAYNDRAWGELLGDYEPGELMAEWVSKIPMGRVGEGKDVSGLVAFLASEDAAYITGQTVNVDGGMFMS